MKEGHRINIQTAVYKVDKQGYLYSTENYSRYLVIKWSIICKNTESLFCIPEISIINI